MKPEQNQSNFVLISLVSLLLFTGSFILWNKMSASESSINKHSSEKVSYPETISINLNQDFKIGNVKYRVMSAEDKGAKITYHSTTGKFIYVTVSATNEGKEAYGVNTIFISDDKDRKYDRNALIIDMNTKYNSYGYHNNLSGIQAGFSESYYAYFEVAKDSKNLKLVFPSRQGPAIASVNLGI